MCNHPFIRCFFFEQYNSINQFKARIDKAAGISGRGYTKEQEKAGYDDFAFFWGYTSSVDRLAERYSVTPKDILKWEVKEFIYYSCYLSDKDNIERKYSDIMSKRK